MNLLGQRVPGGLSHERAAAIVSFAIRPGQEL